MSGKPDLATSTGVQNVVVYVSNENLAHQYAIDQQHVSQEANIHQNYQTANHTMAPVVKGYPDKPNYPDLEQHMVNKSQQGYFASVIPQNGFAQPGYTVKNFQNNELLPHAGPGRPDKVENCDNRGYGEPYSVIGHSEISSQSVRCDSVRSETAESSCSSLSSADDQNQPSEMVVYDPSVSVRSGGVMLAVGPGGQIAGHPQDQNMIGATPPQFVMVPYGWKRLLSNGSIIYISPSNQALSCTEEVKSYLLSSGTCKCGLECHFKYENTFNFDPKVLSKPWVMSPDTNTGDLQKLCNHKRKLFQMSSLDCKPPDPGLKNDYGITRKRQKIGMPYHGGMSMSQILAQREKMVVNQQNFGREVSDSPQQVWSHSEGSNPHLDSRLMEGYHETQAQNQMRPQDQFGNVVMNENAVMVPQNISQSNQGSQSNQVQMHSQHVIGPNGHIIQIPTGQTMNRSGGMVIQGQQHFMQQQPSEPTGPGRPNIQLMPNQPQKPELQQINQRNQNQQQFNHNQQQQQMDPSKNNRPSHNQGINGYRPQNINNGNQLVNQQYQAKHQHHQQRLQWQQNKQQQQQQQQQMVNMNQHRIQRMPNPQMQPQSQSQNQPMPVYERVPPLHQHAPVWQEEIRRKKVKYSHKYGGKSRQQYHMVDGSQNNSCPNVDVRQIPNDRMVPHLQQQLPHSSHSSSPSFMEDPSGYLAQQTALLNNTINRQNNQGYACNSPQQIQQNTMVVSTSHENEVPLPSNVMKSQNSRQLMKQPPHYMHQMQQNIADSSVLPEVQQYSEHCQGCVSSNQFPPQKKYKPRTDSDPGTPTNEDPVTSSIYSDKHSNQSSPDSRPIQGGTVSTSNVSPADGIHSDPPTPNPHVYSATPPQRSSNNATPQQINQNIPQSPQMMQIMSQSREASPNPNYSHSSQHQNYAKQDTPCCSYTHSNHHMSRSSERGSVTTMASGRTVGHNTITSVLAGRTNTSTVSVNNAGTPPNSNMHNTPAIQTSSINVNATKSPLEMVQSVVSSIQVPQSQHQQQPSSNSSHHLLKQQSNHGLPPGHILVSSNGQLIVANANGQNNVMAPPPPKVVPNQNPMPPISVSPMITNVTGAMTQVIPAVAAQQVLGQQTVLVNALPAPFVLQPGVTMTMDGMTMGQNVQIPQLVAGNMIQQPIQIEGAGDPRRTAGALLSPESKKKGKKRKLPSQTVAGMLHIAAQQNQGVVMSQQGFPQQIQMHSPQGITATTPLMQALTIVPSKNGGPPQIVMNSQPQQIITNNQPQQINLLQPVNLINGTTGVVQNFPTVQQFILPQLGGSMVMNADGTATILQDTSNLGMQLQIQNINGQNVLTPVQNNTVFNNGQGILTAGPTGMVIRPASQGKIIQQQHSPGAAQFLSPNGGQFVVNGAQFTGQLSPLVASVSPSQQVTFNTSPTQIRTSQVQPQQQQEYIQMNNQMGQALMVPCNPQPPPANIVNQVPSSSNTTYVQQNTTIVQQQTTMVANNQNFGHNNQSNQRQTAVNLDPQQNFIISSNDGKQQQMQVVVQQQRNSPQPGHHYRNSVSTQTAANQNSQAVTTNTFCQTSTLGSPPDTTTLSPAASGGQSPPTVDTTTHSGSTDDGLSPAPSIGSDVHSAGNRSQSSAMAMVHCISSSEPDFNDSNTQNSDQEWHKIHRPKYESELNDLINNYGSKANHMTLSYAESSNMTTGVTFIDSKGHQEVVSSRSFEKLMQRKGEEMIVVMETQHLDSSLFDDDETKIPLEDILKRTFVVGDLVWGPTKGFLSYPGKIVALDGELASVKWFGGEKFVSEINVANLLTLTEGLDAHHQARKRARTSRKLNIQLEKAIQEAMSELDKECQNSDSKSAVKEPQKTSNTKVSAAGPGKKSSRSRTGIKNN